MKNILGVFLVLMLSVFALAQTSVTKTSKKDGFKKMSFEVNVDKNNYLLYEPVFVAFKFTNKTEVPQTTDSPSFIHESKLRINFEGAVTVFEHLSSTNGIPGVRFPSIFRPDEFSTSKEIISPSLVRTFFPESGNYQLQFVLFSSDGTQMIESNVIEVEIRNPQGINKEAFDFLQKHNSYFGMSSWAYGGKDGEELLAEFVSKYSQSVYGEIAINSLANIYLGKGELDKAKAEFEKNKSSNQEIIADEAKKSLAEIEKRKADAQKNEQQEQN